MQLRHPFVVLALVGSLNLLPGRSLGLSQPHGAASDGAPNGTSQAVRPLVLTDFGAVSGRDATAALQAALDACGVTGRPILAPAGTYLFSGTAAWPTASGQNCPGLSGEGDQTLFVLANYNGPIIRATVQANVPQTGRTIAHINTQAQWPSPRAAHDRAALIDIDGAGAGWSYSHFRDLGGYAIHHIVKIDTDPGIKSGDGWESYSGWNDFSDFYGGPGSQGVQPDSFLLYARGSSTGNTVTNFRGAPKRAFLRYEGPGYVVGDIVITAGQLGGGRVISIGPNTTFNRNIVIDGTQVDAGSIEVLEWEGGPTPPSRIKARGSFGGSAPWSSVPPLGHSAIDDLGGSGWRAGAHIVGHSRTTVAGVPSNVAELWKVTVARNSMTRVEVSVTGSVGAQGSGGVISTFDVACGARGAMRTAFISGNQVSAEATAGVPAGWPMIATADGADAAGNCVLTLTAQWRGDGTSDLDTNIFARHGKIKVQRGQQIGL